MNFNVRYHGVTRGPKGKGWRWWYVHNPYRVDYLPPTRRCGGAATSQKKARAALYDFLRKRREERDRIEQLSRAAADKAVGDRSDFERRWGAVYGRVHAAATRRSKVLR